jgi:hypothetical protein
MTEAQAVAGLDRLPWLHDDTPARKRSGALLPWALAATVMVAGTSYWLGLKTSLRDPQADSQAVAPVAANTVPLPEARPAQPQIAPTPQRIERVEPLAAEPIAIVEQPPIVQPVRRAPVERLVDKAVAPVTDQREAEAQVDAPAEQAEKVVAHQPPQLWPVRVIDGASGRLVRIGTFGSVHQAKKGWWAIMKVNPALNHLPALVVPVRSLRDGQVYYRLQMGTTSQAHSTVLCQRMRMIAESCVVIGLNGEGSEVAM